MISTLNDRAKKRHLAKSGVVLRVLIAGPGILELLWMVTRKWRHPVQLTFISSRTMSLTLSPAFSPDEGASQGRESESDATAPSGPVATTRDDPAAWEIPQREATGGGMRGQSAHHLSRLRDPLEAAGFAVGTHRPDRPRVNESTGESFLQPAQLDQEEALAMLLLSRLCPVRLSVRFARAGPVEEWTR